MDNEQNIQSEEDPMQASSVRPRRKILWDGLNQIKLISGT